MPVTGCSPVAASGHLRLLTYQGSPARKTAAASLRLQLISVNLNVNREKRLNHPSAKVIYRAGRPNAD